MSEHPDQLPEGALIADALKRSRLSARKAAERAGMSEGRWRQIVKGYQTVSAGVTAPVRGPAETVARMAHVVGVTPEQLEEAGREDAAAELRALLPHVRIHDAQLIVPAAPVGEEERMRQIEAKFEEAAQAAAEGRALLEQLRRERRQGA